MENITVTVKNNIATITMDLSKRGNPSASGKSVIVASTHGSYPLADGVTFSLNAYVKK